MGEYYNWVNVDRKEYICPNDFNYGNKRWESMYRGNEFLNALRELLSEEWKGDHVFFMGDEKGISADTENETLRILYLDSVAFGYPEDGSDTVCESYKNVSAQFKAAEAEARQEILFYLEDLKQGNPYNTYNEYGVDVTAPFDGLFTRSGKDFLYTVNHTKKLCYSLQKTRILSLDNKELEYSDPLPILMAYGRASDTGAWVGDIIGVSNELLDGYKLLEEIRIDW